MKTSKSLKIGMVCPYGWDTPGGVQIHIKELAEFLIRAGHDVSVFAPVSDDSQISEPWLVSAGRPVSIPYNGAVARILFGPVASSRVRQWISAGNFDLLHLHEPAIPSLSLLACWAADGPMVGTFHAASAKQKAITAVGPILEPVLEKLTARIAVSEMARQTLKDHFQTEAVVIPNGLDTSKFEVEEKNPNWSGSPSIGFIGRFDEPRKGLEVLIAALPATIKKFPDLKVLIAGPGDKNEFLRRINPSLHSRLTFLGKLSEEDKVKFFHSIDAYIAPNTGGESFGIILTEAMASGTAILASDIPAFSQLLNFGEFGALFISEDSRDLGEKLVNLLGDPDRRHLLATNGLAQSHKYDWSNVAEQILDVYEMVQVGNSKVGLSSDNRVWNRFKSND
ncbi:MAG: glycosyltransferase family 4 protein [Actinomycetes bacterium]